MAVAIVLILLTLGYGLLILYYYSAWRSVPEFLPPERRPKTRLSVIIPARNEERHIPGLLDSLRVQTYPKDLVETVVVDDHSTDSTAEIVACDLSVRLIRLEGEIVNAQKKKAIETGIRSGQGEFILTTDADCILPPSWLETMAAFRESRNSAFIAAPVRLSCNNSWLERFQCLDFLVLQGITAGSVHRGVHALCNGANLGYERAAFEAVNGFAGIDHIASGDDLLLMQKIRSRYRDRVHYLKSNSAIVISAPMSTWSELVHQRIRWASKTFHYKDARLFAVLALVFAFNLTFLFLLVAGFWNFWYWLTFIILMIIKTLVELPFVASVARFYGQERLLTSFFFFQPLHIAYTIIVGFLGQLGTYRWKGRRVR